MFEIYILLQFVFCQTLANLLKINIINATNKELTRIPFGSAREMREFPRIKNVI